MPTIPPPKPRWRRSLGTPALYDILIALFTLVGGIVAGLLLLQGPGRLRITGGFISLIAAVAIAAFNTTKAALLWSQKNVKESPHGLEGCLYTLHDILNPTAPNDGADVGLRITVHVPSGDGKSLIQLIDYVGSQRKKQTSGRLTPVACGITGRAYRTKEPADLQRATDNAEEYVRVLIVSQGFTEEQARSVDHSTMSAYAAPPSSPPMAASPGSSMQMHSPRISSTTNTSASSIGPVWGSPASLSANMRCDNSMTKERDKEVKR